MDSKEIIKRTITFNKPERLGMSYLVGEQFDSDIHLASIDMINARLNSRFEENMELWEDIWGNTWSRLRTDTTTKGEIHHGFLDSWEKLDSFVLPDLGNEVLYRDVIRQAKTNRDKYILGELPGFCFSIARKLRRLDNFLMDVLTEPQKILHLFQKLEDLFEKMIINYSKAGVDGIFFCEDWGTQNQLLINPKDWVRLIKPSFQRLCNAARRNGIDVWMHSCGYIYEAIPHLLDVGVKVLQLDQPELMGIEKLGREFGGKVTFWSPCDIQKVLPTGDYQLIEESVKKMCEYLYVNNGGLIAKSYGTTKEDLQSIGVKPEWNKFTYECFKKYRNKSN